MPDDPSISASTPSPENNAKNDDAAAPQAGGGGGDDAPDSGTNKAYAASLTRTENIVKAAQQPAHLAALSADGSDITADFLEDTLAEVAAVRRLLGLAAESTSDKETSTGAGLTLEEQLIHAIQQVQARARQKYGTSGPAMKTYHIGHRMGGNRSVLEQISQDILTKLETDTLPGLAPARISALAALRAAYLGTELEQTSAGGQASGERKQAKARIDALVDKRQKIQFAADATWPWPDGANVAVRKTFELPASRPYSA